jgi:hypothetical protein
MKRSPVLGLRTGNLPACVDVKFTVFSGPLLVAVLLGVFYLILGDFHRNERGLGFVLVP